MRFAVAFAAGCLWFAASLCAWSQDSPTGQGGAEPEGPQPVSVLTILKSKEAIAEFKAAKIELDKEQTDQIKTLEQLIEDMKADWKRKDAETENLPKSKRKKQAEANRKAREETAPHFEGMALDGILSDKQRDRVRQIQRQARPAYHLVHETELQQELQLTRAQIRGMKKIWDEAWEQARKSTTDAKSAATTPASDQSQMAKQMLVLLEPEQAVKLRKSMGPPFAGLASLPH